MRDLAELKQLSERLLKEAEEHEHSETWCQHPVSDVIREAAEAIYSQATCTWTQDDYGGSSTWETQCAREFYFEDGGPLSNGFQFCGFCGARVAEIYTSALGGSV